MRYHVGDLLTVVSFLLPPHESCWLFLSLAAGLPSLSALRFVLVPASACELGQQITVSKPTGRIASDADGVLSTKACPPDGKCCSREAWANSQSRIPGDILRLSTCASTLSMKLDGHLVLAIGGRARNRRTADAAPVWSDGRSIPVSYPD